MSSDLKQLADVLTGAISDISSATLTKVSDAPADGKNYARKDNAWVEVVASEGSGLTQPQIMARSLGC